MKLLRSFSFFLSTLIVYLGGPLLGWGFDDLGGFFDHPARAGLVGVVGLFAAAVGWQGYDKPEGVRGSSGLADKLVGRQHIVRRGMVLLLWAMLLFLPFADRRGTAVFPDVDEARWAGLVLAAAGMLLIFLSGLALGRMYSQEVTVQKDHRLVTTGLYRKIRHPRYLGLIVLAVGMALLFRSWMGLGASAVLLAVLVQRIGDEETLLANEFGAEWATYRARSWRLVPYLY